MGGNLTSASGTVNDEVGRYLSADLNGGGDGEGGGRGGSEVLDVVK